MKGRIHSIMEVKDHQVKKNKRLFRKEKARKRENKYVV
jgi:hypothetical protein